MRVGARAFCYLQVIPQTASCDAQSLAQHGGQHSAHRLSAPRTDWPDDALGSSGSGG